MSKRSTTVFFLTTLLGSCLVFIGLSYADEESRTRQAVLEHIRKIEKENAELRIQNRRLNWYKKEWSIYDSTWMYLQRKGFRPDKTIVFGLLRECDRWNVDRSLAVEWSCKESSMFTNLFGAAGEVGGFQMMPETIRMMLLDMGADTIGFRPEHYLLPGDNIPMAMYTMKFLQRQNPGIKLDHERDWRSMSTAGYKH